MLYKTLIPGGIGLVVGVAIGMLWGGHWCPQKCEIQNDGRSIAVFGTTTEQVSTTTTTAQTSTPILSLVFNTVSDPLARIDVTNQPAGALVVVKHVDASLPTWIAIREVVGQTVGNILGARLVAQSSDDVSVDLLRSTDADSKYQIYLYQDDGDSIFDFERDLLITQKQQPVTAGFVAQ